MQRADTNTGSPGLDSALALPPQERAPARAGFPWLASCAPVIGALVLWAITGSIVSLVFAALGPVVALASMADGSRQASAGRRRREAERRAALDRLADEVRRRHDTERAEAWRETPPVRDLLTHAPGAEWHRVGPGRVVIGRGERPSSVRIGGVPADDHDRAVMRRAECVDDAPVLIDVSFGLGLIGPPPLVRAAARAALVQLVRFATPGQVALRVPASAEWAWAGELPHRAGGEAIAVTDTAVPVERGRGAPRVTWHVAMAPTASALPPGCGTVLRVERTTRAVIEREHGHAVRRVVVPELVSAADVGAWAARVRTAAARVGLAAGTEPIPDQVPLERIIPVPAHHADRAGLAVAVGISADGPVVIDLVCGGPHALVAGTSGSGKSEFLLAWLTALAVAYPPRLVSFLLVDFKGGAAFEPLRGLPHVAGLVTDLDETEAVRAVESLGAELRHREEVLKRRGCRAIAELPEEEELPRLVIVVDEFQAMAERFPELSPLIADIAARGRSLGVHLVLAAQRPNGVVREGVTANCGLRVSLRVLSRADSIAVLGVDAAAGLDAGTPGRALVASEGGAVEFQSAIASPAVIADARRRTVGPAVRRPWLDPLPSRLGPDDLARIAAGFGPGSVPEAGVVFGIADEPERQRRALAVWRPEHDGPMLVTGAALSGRSTALGAIAASFARRHGAAAVSVLGGPPSTEWDVIHEELARLRRGTASDRLLVIDDVDARYRSWPDEHRLAVLDVIASLCREGRVSSLHVVASAASLPSLAGPVRDAFGLNLVLRQSTRVDVVHAGGTGALWRADDPPGAGQWRGRRVQVVDAGPVVSPIARPVPSLRMSPDAPVAIVSLAPARDADVVQALSGRTPLVLRQGEDAAARALTAMGLGPVSPQGRDSPLPALPPIVVGDAEAWAAQWSLLAAIRERGLLVVHAGSSELRAVSRLRTTPPMLDPGGEQCWGLLPGEPPVRLSWPPGPRELRIPHDSNPEDTDSAPPVVKN